jgi:hypothetical protein
MEKLDFCSLALRDIQADDKYVGLTVDFNNVGRLRSPPARIEIQAA